jgi:peptidyl-prolyl cis-trans isomerase A (cyclophilin A)
MSTIHHSTAALLLLGLLGAGEAPPRPRVVIATDRGDLACELFPEQAPATVANFLGLAAGTKEWTDPASGQPVRRPFYDGLTFHRIILDFMVQGGCPAGDGSGGPGYAFADEINARSLGLEDARVLPKGIDGGLHEQCAYLEGQWRQRLAQELMMKAGWIPQMTPPESQRFFEEALFEIEQRMSRSERFNRYGMPLSELAQMNLRQLYEKLGYHYRDDLPASSPPVAGTLCMANAGPGTNGSQFFITLRDTPHLTGKHTVFGRLVAGQEVLNAIATVPVIPEMGHRPRTAVKITSIRPVAAP